MNRLRRGMRARRGGLLTLAGMSAVVVAGAVTVIGFADRAGSSLMLASPLVLLGVVAVPSTGQELGAARRDEIAVARLRGLHGAGLVRLLTVEPALAVGLGGLAGYVLGTVGVWATTRWWLLERALWPGWPATLAALALVAVTLAAVMVGMGRAVREPLADQVAISSRPRPMSTLAIFGSLLVVMAAFVATYRAQSGSDDPDWVVLVGPAFVALAAGQVAVWLLGALTRVAVARSVASEVPVYLAVRRLRGTAGVAGPIRLLVAATVLATLALGGAGRVDAWTDQMARLDAGAAVQVPFDGGALEALQLTRSLDPQGRWLMAAAFVPGPSGGSSRRVFVDSERYDRVVGDLLDDAAGTSLGAALATVRRAAPAPPVILGDTWRVGAVVARETGIPAGLRARVTLAYITDTGVARRQVMVVPLAASGPPSERTARLPECAAGCVATGLDVSLAIAGRPFATPRVPLLLTTVTAGDVDLLERPWRVDTRPEAIRMGPAGLRVTFTVQVSLVQMLPDPGPLPVLATPDLAWPGDDRTVNSAGGVTRDADVVGEVAGGPFVRAEGVVADLPQALAADAPTVPTADVTVLARAGTPEALLDAVVAAGGRTPRPLAGVRRDVVDATGAGQARAFALMALFCVAVAVLALIGSAARLRTSYQREVAALRLLGVPARQIRRAARSETVVLAVAATAVGVLGGVLAVRLLLGSLPVVRLPEHAVALSTTTPWWAVLIAGALGVGTLVAVQGAARRLGDEATRPATLREGVSE